MRQRHADTEKLDGKRLTELAEIWGVPRRWRGWEPDWLLVRRLRRAVRRPDLDAPGGGRRVHDDRAR